MDSRGFHDHHGGEEENEDKKADAVDPELTRQPQARGDMVLGTGWGTAGQRANGS